MKHLWNFLALWAGTVLTVFIAYEVLEAIKAIVATSTPIKTLTIKLPPNI